jgi:hypothetical protein
MEADQDPIQRLLTSEAASLLREVTRQGASFRADAEGSLVIEPETALLGNLREKLFDREPEAVEVINLLSIIKNWLDVILGVMREADEVGTRYARLVNGELAIYSIRAPLPHDLWYRLHELRQEISDGLALLGVIGPVGFSDIVQIIDEYQARPEWLC